MSQPLQDHNGISILNWIGDRVMFIILEDGVSQCANVGVDIWTCNTFDYCKVLEKYY